MTQPAMTATPQEGEFVLVPRQPTEAMIIDGRQALLDWDARTGDDMGMTEIYRAMLAAAPRPQPPQPTGDVGELNAALELAADCIKAEDGGDPSTETGWHRDEYLAAWLAIKSLNSRLAAQDETIRNSVAAYESIEADMMKLEALLMDENYISWRADYAKGHLSWANSIEEREKKADFDRAALSTEARGK